MEPNEPEKAKVKTFDKCPLCSLKEWIIKHFGLDETIPEGKGFFADIVKRMKENGLAKEGWDFCYDQRTGPVANEQMLKTLPTGAQVPSYFFKTDICSDCGCIYVTKLEEGTAQKKPQIVLPTNIPANRAERRRMERNN